MCILAAGCASSPPAEAIVRDEDQIKVFYQQPQNGLILELWSTGCGDPSKVYSTGRNSNAKVIGSAQLQELLIAFDELGVFDNPAGAPAPVGARPGQKISVQRGDAPPHTLYWTERSLPNFIKARTLFSEVFNSSAAFHTGTGFDFGATKQFNDSGAVERRKAEFEQKMREAERKLQSGDSR